MASRYHRNAVLTGCVDSFCLVCESHLRSEHDVVSHIQKPVHLKNLSSAPYFEKFTEDHIRKVKKGYFCECCNILFPTAAKVGLHVKEQTHNEKKVLPLIKRSDNHVIILDNILITEQAWNGVIMDTCAVCNMEFYNMKLHLAEQKHVLNLIQKKVEFVGNTVYRKIDDTSFHCLICNAIFALNTVITHTKEQVHETHVHKCQMLYKTNFENDKKCPCANSIDNDKDSIKTHYENKTSNNDKVNAIIHVNEEKTEESKESNKKSHCANGIDNDKDALKTKVENNTSDNDKVNGIIHVNEEKTETSVENFKPIDNPTNTKKPKKSKTNLKTVDNTRNTVVQNKTKSVNENKKDTSTEKEKNASNTQSEMTNAKLVTKNVDQTTNKINDTKNIVKIDKNELFEHLTEFQKNGVNINFENETAFCKKCFESVHLDIEVIKQHISDHKSNPKKEVTANTVHTMNQDHSKTVLHSKEKDKEEKVKRPNLNFDQNHNVTKRNAPKESTKEKEEEIIKIDLRKNSSEVEDIDENETNYSITRYVPGKSSEETAQPSEAEKPAENMNEREVFAKNNNLTYNQGNNNVFCRICSTRIPAAIQNMKEHVKGMAHKTNMARIAQKNVIPKKHMSNFIHIVSRVANVDVDVDDVIVNDKFCLTRMSYFMITTQQQRLRCQACEVNLDRDEISRHVDGVFHERAMNKTPVVTSLDSEFIREVRPAVFHCGYCNLMVGEWAVVSSHLQSAEHKVSASSGRRRLADHMPDILAHRHSNLYRNIFLEHLWPFF